MPTLVPVDHDPFATPAPAQQPAPQPTLVPVDADPFANDPGRWLEGDAKAAYDQWRAQQAAPQQPPQLGAGTGSAIATAGGLLEGIPVAGPAIRGGVNRAAAALHSGDYADNLKAVDQITAQAKKDHPVLDTGSQIAGGVLATAPLVAAAPAAFGAGKGSLLARTLLSGLTGAGLNGVDAAVRSDFDPVATGIGTAAGAGFGLAGPVVGQLAGRGVNMLAQELISRRAPVPGLGNAAANMATEDFVNAGGRAAIDSRMGQLGPEAMLLDASPSHLGSAQGLGVRPETREIINQPLTARNKGANARLTDDVQTNFGPDPVPSQIEAGLDASREALRPEYGRVLAGAGPVDTDALAKSLDDVAITERGAAQDAVRQVRKMLNEVPDPNAPPPPPGAPPAGPKLDTNPATLLNTRQAIDGMMKTEVDPNALRVLGDARKAIDAELTAKVPGIKDVDAQHSELARQSDGLKSGVHVLDTGREAIRPVELAKQLTEAAQPKGTMVGPSAEPLRIQQGALGDIYRNLGTKANDLVALKQYVMADGDWNPQKLAQLFGPDEARNVINSVDRETAFRDAYNKVVENSQTEMRRAASDRFAVRGEGPASGDGGLGLPLAGVVAGPQGLAVAAGAKGVAKGVSKAATMVGAAEDIARNKQLAEALIMKNSPELNVMLDALGRRASLAGKGDKAGQVADRLVRALLQSQGGRVGQQVPRLLGY